LKTIPLEKLVWGESLLLQATWKLKRAAQSDAALFLAAQYSLQTGFLSAF